ncbi:MAG: hypothetical protein KKI02_02840 [Planctomycetes bacterium]|nr:hypothetical protein [Planctomycetota bacterium]
MRNVAVPFAASLLTLAAASAGVVDDLEDIGPDCTPVTARIIGGVAVTIYTQGGSDMTAHTYYDDTCVAFWGHNNVINAPLNPENVSGTRFIASVGFPGVQPIIFELNAPVTSFGLTTLDLLEDDSTCNPVGANLTLRAYDASNDIVDEQALEGAQGSSGLDLDWFVSGDGIVKVELTGGDFGDCGGYGIDDLVIDAPDCDGDGIFDDKDVCPCVPAPGGVDAEGRPLGDLDCDCDVDLADLATLLANYGTGP